MRGSVITGNLNAIDAHAIHGTAWPSFPDNPQGLEVRPQPGAQMLHIILDGALVRSAQAASFPSPGPILLAHSETTRSPPFLVIVGDKQSAPAGELFHQAASRYSAVFPHIEWWSAADLAQHGIAAIESPASAVALVCTTGSHCTSPYSDVSAFTRTLADNSEPPVFRRNN